MRQYARCPGQFGPPQHTTVQRLLRALRRKAAGQLIAREVAVGIMPGALDIPAPPTSGVPRFGNIVS